MGFEAGYIIEQIEELAQRVYLLELYLNKESINPLDKEIAALASGYPVKYSSIFSPDRADASIYPNANVYPNGWCAATGLAK